MSEDSEYIYFDLESARKLLPWLKSELQTLKQLRYSTEIVLVNGNKEELEKYAANIDKIVREITGKGIILRNPDIGLVDFPAVINGRPAYLCWKVDEDDIRYWHYVEEGFRGRKEITGKEDILSFL
ncbi:MAG: DUF2203 family protein [Candidatus Aramenus sp.]|jgi:hypothetical protein|nr:DUF2203 family protein [Candidatus Aramenus sp.]